jgi:selenide,water dikinase
LRPIQDIFDPASYPDLLVGLSEPDDAAVWRLSDERAIVVTTDFFTPVVDTAYEYGAIAAANSLSDVYAMGGKPFLALNITALPEDLPLEVSSEIMRGGAEKAREAGVVIAGGHSVKDKEPKYGLVVIGYIDPNKMLRKNGLKAGDALVLTKPLGAGVTTTALKQEKADAAHIKEAIEWMSGLNKTASELALEFGLQAGTDVTGFGLLGHGIEMAEASHVLLQFDYGKLPFLSGARNYAEKGFFPSGANDNKKHFGKQIHFDDRIDKTAQMLLFDPQTSGGLLLGVPSEKVNEFLLRSKEKNQPAWVIGMAVDGKGIKVN